ncbi:MAG: ribonuclease Z [Thermodesulfobacteriota bacterium]
MKKAVKQSPLELLFLGSGNGFAPGRNFSSFLLDGRILFEPSPTSLPFLKKRGIPLHQIDYVFVSHFHGDHCFGLPFLFLDHYFVTRRERPLTIIGQKGTRKFSNQLMEMAFPKTRKRYAKNFPVVFQEVGPGRTCSLKELTFTAYRMYHAPTAVLGFRIVYKKRRLAYSGDTGPCAGLLKLIQGVNVAILEMSSLKDDYPSHLNRQNILDIRKILPSESRLILTHLPFLTAGQKKALRENPYGALDLAEDGKVFQLD